MKFLTKEERDLEAKEKNPRCPCGESAIGAWGFQIGDTGLYTPKLTYCRDHLSDMIDGLEMITGQLIEIERNLRVSDKPFSAADFKP